MKDTNTITNFKLEKEGESIEFELFSYNEKYECEKILNELLDENWDRIDNLNVEIDRLTNKADKIDNWVSICSGIICGLIDIFYVGDLNLSKLDGFHQKDPSKGNEIITEFISSIARKLGYKGDSVTSGPIDFMQQYCIESDAAWRKKGKDWISSPALHHLEDLCHHPSPLGLAAAIVSCLFRIGIFSNKNGETKFVAIPFKDSKDKQKVITYWTCIGISGILYWISCALCRHYTHRELCEQPKYIRLLIKTFSSLPMISVIAKISLNWAGHLISDMNGTPTSAGKGAGIPGLFLSLMKEISMIPPFCNTKLPEEIHKLYSRTNNKVDLRNEFLPVVEHLGKQAVPVILNEIIVSSFYFVRQLTREYKKNNDFNNVEWSKIIPYGNRTIARMRTISSGVFTAIDMAAAAIETAVKGGYADPASFIIRMALKVNIVGVGRFVIALGNDMSMGMRKYKMKGLRRRLMSERLYLLESKLYILKENAWVELDYSENALEELEEKANEAVIYSINLWNGSEESLNSIETDSETISEITDIYL